jgi:hypothetical protein
VPIDGTFKDPLSETPHRDPPFQVRHIFDKVWTEEMNREPENLSAGGSNPEALHLFHREFTLVDQPPRNFNRPLIP